MLEEQKEHLLINGRITKLTPVRYKSRFPYLKEVDSLALANEQLNLESAFRNYFKNKHNGFPKFKSKKKDHNSYTTNLVNDNIVIGDGVIKLPKVGEIKTIMHREIEEALSYFKKSYSYGKRISCLLFIYACESRLNRFEIENAIVIDSDVNIYI